MPKHPILNIDVNDPKLPEIETMLRDGESYATEILQIQNEDKIRANPEHVLAVWKYIEEVGGPVVASNKIRFYRLNVPLFPPEFKTRMMPLTLELIKQQGNEPVSPAIERQFAARQAPDPEPTPPPKKGWARFFGR